MTATKVGYTQAAVEKANRDIRVKYQPVDLVIGDRKIRVSNDASGDAIADRLKACWNACEGMDDPAAAEIARLKAEDHPGPHEKSRILAELTADLAAARKLCDEFESVASDVLNMLAACGYGGSNQGTANRHEKRLRIAIQNAKEQTK